MSFLAMGLLPLKQAYASTELVIRSIGNVTMQFLSIFTGKYNKRMRKNVKEMERLWKDMKKNGKEFQNAASNISKNFKGAYEEIKDFVKEGVNFFCVYFLPLWMYSCLSPQPVIR